MAKYFYPDKFYTSDGFEYRKLNPARVIDGITYHWKFKPLSRHKEYHDMNDMDKMWDYATENQIQAWKPVMR